MLVEEPFDDASCDVVEFSIMFDRPDQLVANDQFATDRGGFIAVKLFTLWGVRLSFFWNFLPFNPRDEATVNQSTSRWKPMR
jgi:hypothetical protein